MKTIVAIALCAAVAYADAREWPPGVCIALCGAAVLALVA